MYLRKLSKTVTTSNKTIRVLYVLNSTLEYGGATKSFLLMLKGLTEHGVIPTVVVPDTQGVYGTLEKMGIRVVAVPFRFNTYPPTTSAKDRMMFLPRIAGRMFLNSMAVRKLKKLLRDDALDIIHSNVSIIDIGARLSESFHIPHIYHIREYGDKDFGYRQIPCRQWFLKLLQKKWCWSIFITKALKSYYEMDGNPNSTVIYNPIYSANYAVLNENKKPYFLYAGRLDRGKGVFDLLEAYIRYTSAEPQPLHLYIAGDTNGGDKHVMAHMAREAGIEKLVHFLGYRDDIATLMQEATAIVIPSYHEAFGRCLTEAMFNGCLTIGRNTGGTREQYDNGMEILGREIGLRFSSTEELVTHLKDVTKMSKEQILRIVGDAQKVVTELYSIENNVRKIHQFYHHIKYKSDTVSQ